MIPLKKPNLEVKLIHRQECEVIFLSELNDICYEVGISADLSCGFGVVNDS